jgi:TfoX/Sxy family transcriptional regulator of competence genes
MAFDETLAARVPAVMAERDEVSKRQMFGGRTFLLGGHMCCSVHGDELILRLRRDRATEALAAPHVRPMDR